MTKLEMDLLEILKEDCRLSLEKLAVMTGATTTVFPRKDQKLARPVESHDGGTIDISPDGTRMMVAI